MIFNESLPSDGNRVFEVTTAPSVEPITVTELKTFARIDGSDEDTLLSGFIAGARQACEKYLKRALIEQTIDLKMDYWPGEVVELPMPPLLSITKVATLDEDDTETEYSSSYYYIISEAIPGKLILRQGVTPPINTERDYGGFLVRYKAGYGTGASDVPDGIKEAIKLWATDIYENRVVRSTPPPEARVQLDIYRVLEL